MYKHCIVLAETIEERMNLEQAIAASSSHLACRGHCEKVSHPMKMADLITNQTMSLKAHWVSRLACGERP
jgi:hypothetical protein